MARIWVLLLVTACAARTTPSCPAHVTGIEWPTQLDHVSTPQTHHAAAVAVFEVTRLRDAMSELVRISVEQQLQLHPNLEPVRDVMQAFMAKYLSYDAVRDELADAYVARFDELQLRQLVAFYRTSTGQVAATKMPELVKIGGQIGIRHVQEHTEELQQMIRSRMEQNHPSPISRR